MKVVKRALNSDGIMKELEVLVFEGRVFYIFSCKDEIIFFALSSYALNLVIYCEKARIILSFSMII